MASSEQCSRRFETTHLGCSNNPRRFRKALEDLPRLQLLVLLWNVVFQQMRVKRRNFFRIIEGTEANDCPSIPREPRTRSLACLCQGGEEFSVEAWRHIDCSDQVRRGVNYRAVIISRMRNRKHTLGEFRDCCGGSELRPLIPRTRRSKSPLSYNHKYGLRVSGM